ncbi:MAG: DNA translocase FtsK [Defluviitaleaceae bacterium]|nr:DNA translocase FtsK [Defluviitaleaceae bacterium]
MATKSSAGKKKQIKGKKPEQKQNPIRREIIAICIIAAAVLMLISLFVEDAGFIGRLANSLVLGIFGIGAFVLPILALVLAGIMLVGKTDLLSRSKTVMGGCIFLLCISIIHMMLGPARPEDMGFWQYIGHIYTNGGAANGGLLGAATSRLFVAAISEVGTYILFFTVLAILLILITGRSLFALLQSGFFRTRDTAVRFREQRAEARAKYYEEEYEADFEDYKYTSPNKKPHNLIMDEGGAKNKGDDDEKIDLLRGIGAAAAQKLAPRPKSPKDMLLAEDEPEVDAGVDLEVAVEPVTEPTPKANEEIEIEIEIDLPEEEFAINVRGIVEGYTPAAVKMEDFKEDDDPPPFDVDDEEPATAKAHIEEKYIFPPVELLRENTYQPSLSSRAQILENSKKLEETLQSFGVSARVVEVSKGPTVTRYELSPGSGVKVSKISGLADDLALNLAAAGIRIEAPIPNKSVVGIEIPNKDVQAVYLREVIDDEAFWNAPGKLSFAMGKDIAGNIVIADIARMPHLLIAGATGSGKSVCINTLITSIIYKATPSEVKLLMIDPKVVELSVYNGIPHLLIPVVTDPKKASGALAWAVREMDNRYNMFAETRVRDLAGYNNHLAERGQEKLPQIVIIIDELADLMMTCGKEVEESICRLAQKARAAGIHLIVATQRPSVDVITGLIKANVPSRLAFAVSSGTDSRTILDTQGAEKLLGKGDMLFSPVGLNKPQRIQGSFISDKEVENIVNFIKQDGETEYSEEMIEKITTVADVDEFSADSDPLIDDAIGFIVEREKASTSMLQRRFRIGYNRAARMMEELWARGLVGPEDGAKPRKVLMTPYQYREYIERRRTPDGLE